MANNIVPHHPSQPPGRVRAVSAGPAEQHTLSGDFSQYFDILRRRWWLVLTAGVLALATGWWTQRGRLDQYTAEVLLQHSQDSEMVAFGLGAQTGADFGSRLEILRSAAVLSRVVDDLGLQARLADRGDLRTKIFGDIHG